MDNEQARLEVLETRLNIVRKFLIMISDIKLLRLGVSGASIPRLSVNHEAHKKRLFDKTFAELLTHTKQLVEAYKISEGKVGTNAEVDEETVAEIQRLAELLYSPSTYFSADRATDTEKAIDTRLNEIDMTNRWDVSHHSDRATSHEMAQLHSAGQRQLRTKSLSSQRPFVYPARASRHLE